MCAYVSICTFLWLHVFVHMFGLSSILQRECAKPLHECASGLLLCMLHFIWSSLLLCLYVLFLAYYVLRYSITVSLLFCCAQVPPYCNWDVCISLTACDNVYQRPRQLSTVILSWHTHTGIQCNCVIRMLCAGVWTTKQGGVKRICVCLCGCLNGRLPHQPERRNQRRDPPMS